MITSADSFPLMAIPFFMLVGTLMEKTGIARRLVDIASILTGDTPGGLGMAAIVASMFFAAISGSGPATAAAIGGIMLPAMIEQRYSRSYSPPISSNPYDLLLYQKKRRMKSGQSCHLDARAAGIYNGFVILFKQVYLCKAISKPSAA